MDYVSKNLGKNWHCFFRSLGFTQGRIETAEINAAGYDISEVSIKLNYIYTNYYLKTMYSLAKNKLSLIFHV